jgi:hypothetical protein
MDGWTKKNRWTKRMDGLTNRWMDKWTDRQMDRQKERRSERQIKDVQTDKRKNITDCPL